MRQTRLKINLESLWENPRENFTVRYSEINEQSKQTLATRIKTTAKIASIRKPTGPTVEKIQEALAEINPIIFSEYENEDQRWIKGHQRFGKNNASYIAGWRYERLCQAIYKMTCIKRELEYHEILSIARLSSSNYDQAETLLSPLLTETVQNNLHSEEETFTPIEDLGIEDIRRARERAEQRGTNTIPEEMREEEIINPNTRTPEHIDTRPNQDSPYHRYTQNYRSVLTVQEANRRRERQRVNEARIEAGQPPIILPPSETTTEEPIVPLTRNRSEEELIRVYGLSEGSGRIMVQRQAENENRRSLSMNDYYASPDQEEDEENEEDEDNEQDSEDMVDFFGEELDEENPLIPHTERPTLNTGLRYPTLSQGPAYRIPPLAPGQSIFGGPISH